MSIAASSFRTFIRAAALHAPAAGLRLPMQKLREAIALACYNRGYSACLAALAAGDALDGPLPPRFIDVAATRFTVSPDALHGLFASLAATHAPLPAESGLPPLAPRQLWHILGAAGTGKTSLARGIAAAAAREHHAATLYIRFGRPSAAEQPSAPDHHEGATGAAACDLLMPWLERCRGRAAIALLDDIEHCAPTPDLRAVLRDAMRSGITLVLAARSHRDFGPMVPDPADVYAVLEPVLLSPHALPAAQGSLPDITPAGNASWPPGRQGVLQGVVAGAFAPESRAFALPLNAPQRWFA